MIEVKTQQLGGKTIYLRERTSDEQVWADTFNGRYHIPPDGMPTPATVLDLGSNIGLTCAHYQHLWPHAKIVGVEMDHGNVGQARLNFDGLILANAIYTRDGLIPYNTGLRAEAFMLGSGDGLAQGVTMQTVIERHLDGMADFVKMDVEGTEWELFADAASLSFVRYLLVEVHGTGPSVELVAEAVGALEKLGFEARHHPPHPQAVWAWRS